MPSFDLFRLIPVLGFLHAASSLQPQQYDVVVYGSTPAGISSAIMAARSGKTVVILEPTSNIGGMSAAGGIGLRDIGDEATIATNCVAHEWAMLNAQHYNVSYPVWQPDMYISTANFLKLIQAEKNINLQLNVPFYEGKPNVQKKDTTILAIATGENEQALQWWFGKIFIEASYDGDIIINSNITYTYGRESAKQYNEANAGVQPFTSLGQFTVPVSPFLPNGSLASFIRDGPFAPVGSSDGFMMGYSYRLCVTNNAKNKAAFPQPSNYSSEDFALVQNYLDALVKSEKYPSGPPFGYLFGVYNYRSYPPADKWDLCDSDNSAITSDAVFLNEKYVESKTRSEREAIAAQHSYYVAGLLHYLSTDKRVPNGTQTSVNDYGLCADEWTDNNHWPPQLYIREGVRIVGDTVFTQNNLIGGRCLNDSISTTTWNIDIHVMQRRAIINPDNASETIARNEGEMRINVPGNGTVIELPYSLILPKRSEATNLLSPVLNSISHVAYGAIRVEPTFMQLGQAAGLAASLAIDGQIAVQSVSISSLQAKLISSGINIHFPVDHCK